MSYNCCVYHPRLYFDPHLCLSMLTCSQILKEKIIFGLSLDRIEYKNNDDRVLPMEIVHAASYSVVGDDSF